jgi:hypothetical protein
MVLGQDIYHLRICIISTISPPSLRAVGNIDNNVIVFVSSFCDIIIVVHIVQ